MDLRLNEKVLRIYRRHKTPYIWLVLRWTLGLIPLIGLIWGVSYIASASVTAIVGVVVFLIFAMALLHTSLLYWLDHLTITDHRVVFTNWPSIFGREEHDAGLGEIQDIKTRENGFIARWYFFDYGLITIETSASGTTIVFDNAPDPEGIKKFLSRHLNRGGGERNDIFHQVMDVMID